MAMVDLLAQHLSEMTGTQFVVLRHHQRGEGVRYTLRAEREGRRYFFQSQRLIKLREMSSWLASICDMVNMGFIPAAPLGKLL